MCEQGEWEDLSQGRVRFIPRTVCDGAGPMTSSETSSLGPGDSWTLKLMCVWLKSVVVAMDIPPAWSLGILSKGDLGMKVGIWVSWSNSDPLSQHCCEDVVDCAITIGDENIT